MIKNFSEIISNDFYRKILQGFAGNSIGLIVPIVVLPLVSRFYSPEDYGRFALFNSIYFLSTIISTGMYSSAILKERNEVLNINLMLLCIIISFFLSIFSFLCVLFLFSIDLEKNYQDLHFLFYLPVLILLFGISTTLSSSLQRAERIKHISIITIINTFVYSGSIVIFGYFNFGYSGFIYSLLLSQFICLIVLLRFFSVFNTIEFSNLRTKYIFHVAKKYINFPKYNLALGLFDGLADNLIIYSISYFFGTTILGQFTFAKNIIMRPLQLIVSSVNSLFYRRLVIMKDSKENYFLFARNLLLILVLIASPFFLLLITFGAKLFDFLFGSNWSLAATISLILLPRIFMSYINGAISSTPLVFNQLRMNTIFMTLNNFLPIIFFIIASYSFNKVFYSFSSYSVISFLLGCLALRWYYSLLKT